MNLKPITFLILAVTFTVNPASAFKLKDFAGAVANEMLREALDETESRPEPKISQPPLTPELPQDQERQPEPSISTDTEKVGHPAIGFKHKDYSLNSNLDLVRFLEAASQQSIDNITYKQLTRAEQQMFSQAIDQNQEAFTETSRLYTQEIKASSPGHYATMREQAAKYYNGLKLVGLTERNAEELYFMDKNFFTSAVLMRIFTARFNQTQISPVASEVEVNALVKKAASMKSDTLVFKGLYLGMSKDDCLKLLNYYNNGGVLNSSEKKLQGDGILAELDQQGNVTYFAFDRIFMNKLFGVNGVELEMFLQTFIDAYGVPNLETENINIPNVAYAWQQVYEHDSDLGYELRFFGDVVGDTGQALAAQLYSLSKTPGTMTLKKVKSKKSLLQNFD